MKKKKRKSRSNVKKGTHHTEESKRKLSKTRRRKFKSGEIKSTKGYKHTEITRTKMRHRWRERKMEGYEQWNKGHTKDTHPSIAQAGETQKKTKSKMNIVPWNKGKTKETDPRIATYGEKHSIFMKEYSNRPEVLERLRAQAVQLHGKFPKTNTSIEILLQNSLREDAYNLKLTNRY